MAGRTRVRRGPGNRASRKLCTLARLQAGWFYRSFGVHLYRVVKVNCTSLPSHSVLQLLWNFFFAHTGSGTDLEQHSTIWLATETEDICNGHWNFAYHLNVQPNDSLRRIGIPAEEQRHLQYLLPSGSSTPRLSPSRNRHRYRCCFRQHHRLLPAYPHFDSRPSTNLASHTATPSLTLDVRSAPLALPAGRKSRVLISELGVADLY